MGGLAPELGEPGRVHRLLAGRPLGQRLELEERRPVLEHPGRRQPDPRRRRVVVGRLRRLVPRPRRLGPDSERRRDHDRGVQLPPRRHVRHAHDHPVQLDVAERLHPHQGHRRAQHRVTRRDGHRAGRPERPHHQRQVERDQPRLPLPVARQREPDRRGHREVVQTDRGPARSAPARQGHRDEVRLAHGIRDEPAHRLSRSRRLHHHRGPGHLGHPPGRSPAERQQRHLVTGRCLHLPLVRGRHADRRRDHRHVHPDGRRAGPTDPGQGDLGARRLQDPVEVLDVHRPGRAGAVPGERGADDLRHGAGRPGPHREAPAPGPRPASSICSGWRTASPSPARPGRRTT